MPSPSRGEPSTASRHPRPWERPHPTGSSRDASRSEQKIKDDYFLHLYEKAPDFRELAKIDPDFASLVQGRRELDFNDPRAVVQLTKTLLRADFGLDIQLPDDRLCPPVANRHNYILWLKDLLDTTSHDGTGSQVVGLDIGTGASCIYPLLGCTERPWSFVATDTDEKSLACARENLKLNHLESRIEVLARDPDDPLIPVEGITPSLTFTMTNPPFYESEDAMLRSASEKSRPAFTTCTGSKGEMVTPGGEVAFVSRILQESLVLRGRVAWYTAMLGFQSSLTRIVAKLKEHGVDNYAVTEFVQGSKTRRWAVGWSFRGMRPAQDAARGAKAAALRALLPPLTEFVAVQLPLPKGQIVAFADAFSGAVAALELVSWHWDRERLEGVGRAADKVWARAWRRRRKREEAEGQMAERQGNTTGTVEGECAFGFKVAIRVTTRHLAVECRWVEGHDESAFESFRGFLKSTAERLPS
ncbi:putative methyltransferase-like protein [Escovopsis weberi]|uniref:Putative methyltransferase-like protein n=1 Tax=Escovopsis weberi TaxID=150374 RepID=A0A0M9VXK5_ESCWE|nr:putative methyltransferase-like protein [Escovopsis weberi]